MRQSHFVLGNSRVSNIDKPSVLRSPSASLTNILSDEYRVENKQMPQNLRSTNFTLGFNKNQYITTNKEILETDKIK